MRPVRRGSLGSGSCLHPPHQQLAIANARLDIDAELIGRTMHQNANVDPRQRLAVFDDFVDDQIVMLRQVVGHQVEDVLACVQWVDSLVVGDVVILTGVVGNASADSGKRASVLLKTGCTALNA